MIRPAAALLALGLVGCAASPRDRVYTAAANYYTLQSEERAWAKSLCRQAERFCEGKPQDFVLMRLGTAEIRYGLGFDYLLHEQATYTEADAKHAELWWILFRADVRRVGFGQDPTKPGLRSWGDSLTDEVAR